MSTRVSRRSSAAQAQAIEPDKETIGAIVEIEDFQGRIFKIGEARENLSRIVIEVGSDASSSVLVGNRGKPSMMCVSYERYRPLLAHGNRTEKFALLVVEELLVDAPQHIRTPAVEELSRLPMKDLETLWGIKSFPLSTSRLNTLKRQMKNPSALDRMAQRAKIVQVLAAARDAGLYDTLSDAMSEVVDEVGQ